MDTFASGLFGTQKTCNKKFFSIFEPQISTAPLTTINRFLAELAAIPTLHSREMSSIIQRPVPQGKPLAPWTQPVCPLNSFFLETLCIFLEAPEATVISIKYLPGKLWETDMSFLILVTMVAVDWQWFYVCVLSNLIRQKLLNDQDIAGVFNVKSS